MRPDLFRAGPTVVRLADMPAEIAATLVRAQLAEVVGPYFRLTALALGV